ncbi:hypothetical protein BV20DRAFT_553614 [Pilatotrama ljubarskyi]|nr:hypothetical protein BV20DRAFT_553614 [Pilatotrama ljubarskyi]
MPASGNFTPESYLSTHLDCGGRVQQPMLYVCGTQGAAGETGRTASVRRADTAPEVSRRANGRELSVGPPQAKASHLDCLTWVERAGQGRGPRRLTAETDHEAISALSRGKSAAQAKQRRLGGMQPLVHTDREKLMRASTFFRATAATGAPVGSIRLRVSGW